MWDLVQAETEIRSGRDHRQHCQDVARERRIADHETLDDRFERLSSAINERLIEFDDRIFHLIEREACPFDLAAACSNCRQRFARFSDILTVCNSCISAYPTSRRESVWLSNMPLTELKLYIRTEMSWSLHDHKQRTDFLIDQLTSRVAHLEAGRAQQTASGRSTPSKHDRAQFFDISDHDTDVPRPADLLPVPGSLFPGGHGSAIPRMSLLGPIDHGSPPGCAAPAEKASTVQSQSSCQNLEEILKRARLRVDSDKPEMIIRTLITFPGQNRFILPRGPLLFRADLQIRQFLQMPPERHPSSFRQTSDRRRLTADHRPSHAWSGATIIRSGHENGALRHWAITLV